MTALGETSQLFSTPYLTVDEYKAAPTAVDYDNLIPGGTAAQNDAELANLIAQASSWMDTYCNQILAATVDVWPTRVRLQADGMLRLHPRYFPVRQVLALSYGERADRMTTATLDASVWVEPRLVEVPLHLRPCNRLHVTLTYVNGYPNTTLTAAVTTDAMPVADATGILAGDSLGVYDLAEGVQTAIVANSWTPTTGPATVPVSTAISAASGVSVSGLPPAVKEAAAHVVTARLKGRGSTALVMAAAAQPNVHVGSDGGANWDLGQAKMLLANFRRVS